MADLIPRGRPSRGGRRGPPREWEQDGKFFVQYVSHNKASREDVANL